MSDHTKFALTHWVARLGTVIIIFFVVINIINEDIRFHTFAPREVTILLALVISICGLIYGWKDEAIGGWMTITGWVIFILINGLHTLFNPEFAPLPIVGLLFIWAGNLRERLEDSTGELRLNDNE